VTEAVADAFAVGSEHGTDSHQLVVGLHDGESPKIAFQAPTTELAPSGFECPEAKLGHGHEGHDDRPFGDERAVLGCFGFPRSGLISALTTMVSITTAAPADAGVTVQ